eukprot:1686546-Rhodomonas_salina.2
MRDLVLGIRSWVERERARGRDGRLRVEGGSVSVSLRGHVTVAHVGLDGMRALFPPADTVAQGRYAQPHARHTLFEDAREHTQYFFF